MAKAFAQLKDNDKDDWNPNSTLIVDALNLCFRWKHTGQYKEYTGKFIDTVRSLAHSYKCSRVIIAADQGSSAYRKELYPEYKGSRKEKYKDQTEEEAQQFKDFFDCYERTLKECELYFTVLRYQDVEADDIAAHLVKHKDMYHLEDIWLISSDGDWDLLVSEDVHRFSWRNRKEIKLSNWSEHYKVTPEQFICYKVLMGDKSDDIPGVMGVGPARAAGLLEMYETSFDIYDSLPLAGTAKYIENLNEFSDQIFVNHQLMDLLSYCDQAIGAENIEDIKNVMLGEDIPW